LNENEPSIKLLEKLGMKKIKIEDGLSYFILEKPLFNLLQNL